MEILTELESVETYVQNIFPSAEINLQTMPKNPIANQFVISFQGDSSETETNYHYRTDREFQVVYFADRATKNLSTMDELKHKLYNDLVIPLNDGSLRYIRIESFSLSQPFETENELIAMLGVLQTSVRIARNQEVYEKIMNVYPRYELKIEL